MKKIGVVIGSSRPARIGAQVTDWVLKNLPENEDVSYEIIDLAEWNLPFFDEPYSPGMQNYQNNHTKKWSEFIKGFQAFVFVTAEYNAGYPAVLKNAIDYLKVEWQEKPSLVISYGWDGGLSANNQLREVLIRVGTKGVEAHPALPFTGREMFTEDGKIKDIDQSYGTYVEEIKVAGQQLVDAEVPAVLV